MYGLLKRTGFDNTAKGFDPVTAYATAGGAGGYGDGDQARRYDATGNDIFVGRPEYSLLKGATFFNCAQGFDHVYGYATAGGTDQANRYDGPGNDNLQVRTDYGSLKGSSD